MTRDPEKGHAALRHGRWTNAGADYFLTICTEAKGAGLTEPLVAEGILQEMHAMEADDCWFVRCATIMPDHVHLLLTLGPRLALGRSIQRLKAKTAACLRLCELQWERGFFDRQMRPDDDSLAVFLYIYLNPYRGGLIARTEKWAHYYCGLKDWEWFESYLDQDLPPPEWIQR